MLFMNICILVVISVIGRSECPYGLRIVKVGIGLKKDTTVKPRGYRTESAGHKKSAMSSVDIV